MGRTTYLHAPSHKWLTHRKEMEANRSRKKKGFFLTGDSYKDAFAQASEKEKEKENLWSRFKKYITGK